MTHSKIQAILRRCFLFFTAKNTSRMIIRETQNLILASSMKRMKTMLVSQTSASHPCREIKRSQMTRASSSRVMLRFQGNNQVLSRTETLTSLTVEIQLTMSKFTNAKILQVHQKILMYQKTNSPSMLVAASKRKALSQFAWPSTLLTNRGHLPLRTLSRLTTRS